MLANVFRRSSTAICVNLKENCNNLPRILSADKDVPVPAFAQYRHSSYRSSHPLHDLSEYPDVEVVQNPPEWKYVERLIAPKFVPLPMAKETHSGWQPAKPSAVESEKYFIARTKNHMMPVYLEITFRGQRRMTVIRRVEGDIWALEQDLRKIVEEARNGKLCASRVNEMSGQVRFHGDYVNLFKDYLTKKGF